MPSYRDIDPASPADIECLHRWGHDDSIRHLFQRFKDEAEYQRSMSLEDMTAALRKSLAKGKVIRLIEHEGQVVGEVSLEIDCEAIWRPLPGTAWFGIVIGEKEAWGQGIGREAMLYIEDLARERGATQAELGVFEFNDRARTLYESLGYQAITETKDFTWWKGKTWTDIRLAKRL
mgnify:CR=1 FL=1